MSLVEVDAGPFRGMQAAELRMLVGKNELGAIIFPAPEFDVQPLRIEGEPREETNKNTNKQTRKRREKLRHKQTSSPKQNKATKKQAK